MEAATMMLARILSIKFTKTVIYAALAASGTALVVACAERAKADDPMVTKAPPIPYANPAAYNWNGFYAGGQMGYAWGTSNWTASLPGAPNVSGSLSLAQRIDIFSQTGSFFAGLQAGYNYMLPNRIVVGLRHWHQLIIGPAFISASTAVSAPATAIGRTAS
jgi:opacity protein-like surface antigen